jgi:hypothetical protein
MSCARFVPILGFLALMATAFAAPSSARGLDVEIWTEGGHDAVYRPGDLLQVRTRTSEDAYLLVYEIDTQGAVHVLFPIRGSSGSVEGRAVNNVPPDHAGLDLVVEETTGEGFIVAIASTEPFNRLPWYLQPYDETANSLGYQDTSGALDSEPRGYGDDEGVDRDGRIVGDPFVAMERIRRQLIDNPDDTDDFATAYTTYYVHEKVKYPRYLCNDCHRPEYYSWWPGFDPYYTACSAFTFRVNWNWYWGAPYWYGYVPYYVYTYLPTCPPHYKVGGSVYYSSWDGWSKWNAMWGGPLVRTKTGAPADYTPPTRYKDGAGASPGRTPPGFLAGGDGMRQRVARPSPMRWRDSGTRVERGVRMIGGTGRTWREARTGRDVVQGSRRFGRSQEAPQRTTERDWRVLRGSGDDSPPPSTRETPRFERGGSAPAPQREAPRVERNASPPPPQRDGGGSNVSPPSRPAAPAPSAPSGGGSRGGFSGGGKGGFGGGRGGGR